MKKEELLKPRYKVIADYPGNNMAVGKVLEFEWHLENQLLELCHYYNQYPHLFKRLEWWEERKAEDMPEYVKLNPETTIGGCNIFKVIGSKVYEDGIGLQIELNSQYIDVRHLLPATESEYLTKSNEGI